MGTGEPHKCKYYLGSHDIKNERIYFPVSIEWRRGVQKVWCYQAPTDITYAYMYIVDVYLDAYVCQLLSINVL